MISIGVEKIILRKHSKAKLLPSKKNFFWMIISMTLTRLKQTFSKKERNSQNVPLLYTRVPVQMEIDDECVLTCRHTKKKSIDLNSFFI